MAFHNEKAFILNKQYHKIATFEKMYILVLTKGLAPQRD